MLKMDRAEGDSFEHILRIMKPLDLSGCDREPIREVRVVPSPLNPLSLTVTIELADHVASCCVNADNAFVEFQGEGGHVRAGFEFRESRPGHQFVASLTLPAPGRYSYRIVANVLGRSLNREGTFESPEAPNS
jgi:hypothetical protein